MGDIAARTPASTGEVGAWTAVVLVASLFPGLGVVIAAVLAFTRLRHNPTARWMLLGVSIAILAVEVVGLFATSGDFEVGPEQRAT
jgi:hypothetical protein